MTTLQLEERRTALRSAYEVADHLTELAPIPPTDAKVQRDCSRGWSAPGVVLHFDEGDAVKAFAARVGAAVVTKVVEVGGCWYAEVSTAGVLAEVPFCGWNWTRIESPEVKHLSAKAVAA